MHMDMLHNLWHMNPEQKHLKKTVAGGGNEGERASYLHNM